MTIHATQLEQIPIGDLLPYEKNPRVHSPAQIQQLCDSIQNFGFTSPIHVDEKNVVLAGHGRLEAATKLGLTTVPVVRVTGLTAAQKRAYVIADNKIGLNSGWNQDLLTVELADLAGEEFSLEVTGFDFRELDTLGVFTSEHAMEPIQLGTENDKSKGRIVNTVLSFGSNRIAISLAELEALEACLKKYEDLYGLYQGFVTWLTEGKPDAAL